MRGARWILPKATNLQANALQQHPRNRPRGFGGYLHLCCKQHRYPLTARIWPSWKSKGNTIMQVALSKPTSEYIWSETYRSWHMFVIYDIYCAAPCALACPSVNVGLLQATAEDPLAAHAMYNISRDEHQLSSGAVKLVHASHRRPCADRSPIGRRLLSNSSPSHTFWKIIDETSIHKPLSRDTAMVSRCGFRMCSLPETRKPKFASEISMLRTVSTMGLMCLFVTSHSRLSSEARRRARPCSRSIQQR